MKVDLPQPEGPITAVTCVTWFSKMGMVTQSSALEVP